MLQLFYLDVTYVLQWFSSVLCVFCKCFRHMFQMFHFVFIRILQVLYLDVSKVDRVLHLSSPRCLLFLDASDVQAVWAHVGVGGVGGA